VYGVLRVEKRAAAHIMAVISTLVGKAHEGRLKRQGQPELMQEMLISSEYADETVFTTTPSAITGTLVRALTSIGRMLGLRATDVNFLDADFWAADVEQSSPAPAGA
jgi:hypothetical protein